MIDLFVVEDQEVTRKGLCAVLAQCADMKVVGDSATGEEALEKILELKPHVVLLDMGLPGLDGASIAAIIKSECPATRIVIYSANANDEAIVSAWKAGADAYLMKGTSIRLLIGAVRTVAAGAAWLDPSIARRTVLAAAHSYFSKQKSTRVDRRELSPREKQIVQLLSVGKSNVQIASELHLSIDTVKTHVRHIMEKLEVKSRTEAAIKAVKLGLAA